jgi:hypothetical protein
VSLVVLLILAVVWGVFLVPQVLRARADRGPADSIGSFRNQLSMIERSLPDTGMGGGRAARRAAAAAAASSQQPYYQPQAQGQVTTFPYAAQAYGSPMSSGSSLSSSSSSIAPSRSELQRRRQNVLLVLLALVVGTLALGLLFRPAFALNIVADVVLAGYVALLVRARAIAAERDMKVRYLPGPMTVSAQAADHRTLRTAAR